MALRVPSWLLAGVGCAPWVAASSDTGDFAGNYSAALSRPGHPFTPSPIYDPSSDIDCNDFKCSGRENSCVDWPLRLCTNFDPCNGDICLHKALFPLVSQDLQFFLAIGCVAVLAAAAGIGGGGINVPMLMILSRFDIKEAVPLSHIAVMGNACAQLMVNTRHRHPTTPHRPLIHYELALLLLPALLGGNSLGVVVGRAFPPTVLIVFSLALLALAGSKTAMKGCSVMKAQRKARQPCEAACQPDAPPAFSTPPGSASRDMWPEVSEADWSGAAGQQQPPMRRSWSGGVLVGGRPRDAIAALLSPSRSHPRPAESPPEAEAIEPRKSWKIVLFMLAFNVVFGLDFLALGSDFFPVERCTAVYWVLLLGFYPFVAASLWVGVQKLRDLAAWHAERNEHVEGDPDINGRTVVLFPCVAVLVGLVAGLLGLGGGEFMVPLLLEFGLMPRVASATSGFLIFFTTSSNVVHYTIAGTMEPFIGYAVACFFLAMCGALVGLSFRDIRYMRENSYLVIYLLAFLLLSSGVLLVYRGLFMSSLDWNFRSFCS